MNKSTFHIRDFKDADLGPTAELFFESVRRGSAPHYTEEQRKAWAPEVPETDGWRNRMNGLKTWIAEKDGEVIGFISLTPNGHIEFAFVHPDWIGKGIALELYRYIEQYAILKQLLKLTSDASLLARPFFERQGWRVITEQRPVRNGIALTNFRMEKPLP